MLLLLSDASGEPAVTYATWNPDDKGTDVQLPAEFANTYARLVAEDVFGEWRNARAQYGKTTGDYYLEMTNSSYDVFDTALPPYFAAGVSTSSQGLNVRLGLSGALGWGYNSDGVQLYPGGFSVVSPGIPVGARIGVSIIRSTSLAKFYLVDPDGSSSLLYSADISAADGLAIFPTCGLYASDIFATGIFAAGVLVSDPADFLISAVPDGCTGGWAND
jgi:hypothetical protein